MTKLSVNINKVATIRNARGGNNPDIVRTALDIEAMGVGGITVHPRPDERHIRYQDVRDLKPVLQTEFNIEGYPQQSFIDLVLEARPTQVTLVPDKPGQITSNSGWDTIVNKEFLTDVVAQFRNAGIRTSIFVDADSQMVEGAAAVGADRVELYTEPYASKYAEDREAAIAPFLAAAETARKCGLGLNAGHDLSLENLAYYIQTIPWTDEVSIGHALICDALYLGLEDAVRSYKACCDITAADTTTEMFAFMADGFEDVEALGVIDVCRRAGINVKTVSIMPTTTVTSAHGVKMKADTLFADNNYDNAQMLFLPGGMPGAANLDAHAGLRAVIQRHYDAGKPLAAICAAPMVYGNMGLLKGVKATCYPGFEKFLTGAEYTAALVEVTDRFLTGKGPAAALPLGYAIVERMKDEDTAEALRKGMMFK